MSCIPWKKLRSPGSKKYELSPDNVNRRQKEYKTQESYRFSVCGPCTLPQESHQRKVNLDLLKANPILESVAGTSPYGTINSDRKRSVTPLGFDIARGVHKGNLSKSDESLDFREMIFERTPSPQRLSNRSPSGITSISNASIPSPKSRR